VVELTEELKDEPEKTKKLLGTRSWEIANLKSMHYILTNIEQKDREAATNFDNAGMVWQYLLEFCLRNNDVNQMVLIRTIITWKKDPAKDIDESLQHLERLNTDLSDSSDGEINIEEKMILAIFLGGLPKEFETTVDSLLAGGIYDRGIVLSRLHEVADRKTPGTGVGGKSASNVKQLTCWNCGEVGHRKSDCSKPEKGSDDKKSGKNKNKSCGKDSDKDKSKEKKSDCESGRGKHRKGKKKSYRRSSRKADDESESGSDETANWIGFIQCGDEESPDAENRAGMARNSARKALTHDAGKALTDDAGKALEYGAREALDIDEPYTEFISEVMFYECAREAESGDDRWVIDSGATTHCTGDISKYESIDRGYRGVLGTPGHRLRIEGKGIAIIPLPEGHSARVRDVLYVPKMKGNLLSTQILHKDGIFNEHAEDGYRFYRKDRMTLATGRNEGRTSYLESVKSPDALMTRNVRSRKEFANLVQENEPEWKLLHQRYGHPGTARMQRIAKRLSIE
jgi:hypothetical protein